MPDLLLLSNTRAPGMGFLTYTTTMRQALARIDVPVTGLHEVSDPPADADLSFLLQTTPRFDAGSAC
jgi:hypothetical protein